MSAAQVALAADGRGGSQTYTAGLARAVCGTSAYGSGRQELGLLDTDDPVTALTVTNASGVDFRGDFGFDPNLRTGFHS